MSGEPFDYRNERQRHEKFVGREALLARLDALLVDDSADRWVVVTGDPGMGKSAIAAERAELIEGTSSSPARPTEACAHVEERTDAAGDYYHLVTLWKSTTAERKKYEESQ